MQIWDNQRATKLETVKGTEGNFTSDRSHAQQHNAGTVQHGVSYQIGWLNHAYGRWAADVYRACLHGAGPDALRGTGNDPIELVGRLTRKLRKER